MKENVIQDKSYSFEIRGVNLYKYPISEKKEYVLSKKILRSGTSIGANSEETIGGQSKKDFISKVSIASKEALETHYWFRILKDTDFIMDEQFDSIEKDISEILKIITSIRETSKQIGN